MTASQIEKKFPQLAKEMNGASEDQCLLYFWKRNKDTKVYEFIDEEAEEQVAEIMGVSIYNEEEEIKKKNVVQRQLTEEEIKEFKDELIQASQQLKEFFSKPLD